MPHPIEYILHNTDYRMIIWEVVCHLSDMKNAPQFGARFLFNVCRY